jgi:hypothetical protein
MNWFFQLLWRRIYPVVQKLVDLIAQNNWEDEFKAAVGTAIEADIDALEGIRIVG